MQQNDGSEDESQDSSQMSWAQLKVSVSGARLVNRARGGHARVELDLSEGGLVAGDVLVQERGQRFGLLRAQIDALKVVELDLALGGLLHSAEDEEEIPHIDPDLHAIGIIFAILGTLHKFDIRLIRNGHRT